MNRFGLIVLLIAGCSVQPKYERPAVELPQAWKQTAPRFAEDGRWWRIYEDEVLDAFVEEGLKSNPDLRIAAARVDEARALAAEARSFLLPTVDAQGSAARERISTATPLVPAGVPREISNYRATLNIAYEVDVFGRLRSGSEAAAAELAASEAGREAVRLALAAQLAQSYYALRSFEQQVALTRQTLDLREETLALQRKRRNAGVIGDFELRQLEAEVAQARAQLPVLEQAREREEVALQLLLGRSPKLVYESAIQRADAADQKLLPAVIPPGMPSELLLRRPDLVEAEQRLAAANARVGVARAELFPSIALTGFLGSESASLSNLFSGGAAVWQLAAAVTQPIFAGGRLEARTEAAQARERAAVEQYLQAVRTAFGEVRTALNAQARTRETFEAETARAEALTETLRLARLRYQSGIASQLEVLDAERGLLDARRARIEALRAHRAAVADLFRALGG
jgi:multidrug efflux system outer membrane protein